MINTPISDAARLASAVRDNWVRALATEFEKKEDRLLDDLLITSDQAAANIIRGRVMQLREIRSLIVQIGEKNG